MVAGQVAVKWNTTGQVAVKWNTTGEWRWWALLGSALTRVASAGEVGDMGRSGQIGIRGWETVGLDVV